MRKLASIMICPMLSFVLAGCSADPPPTPLVEAPTTDAAPPTRLAGKAGGKKKPRKPKPPGVVTHDRTVKPIAD